MFLWVRVRVVGISHRPEEGRKELQEKGRKLILIRSDEEQREENRLKC